MSPRRRRTEQDEPQRQLTPGEVAERLHVSRDTVYRLIADRALRTTNVGVRQRQYRISEDELERFIIRRGVTP